MIARKTFIAWVVDTNSEEGHGFIGRYWQFGDRRTTIPEHLEGCSTAMFTTRELARKNLPYVKNTFPKATVRKARVTITL